MNKTITKKDQRNFCGNRIQITAIAVILLMFATFTGKAQLITEPFNYTAHATNGLTVQSSGTWANVNGGDSILVESGSLTYGGSLPTSTGNKITYGGAGIDAIRPFTIQTSGTVYCSFLFRVNSNGSLNTTGGYTTGFVDGGTSAFVARTFVRNTSSGGTTSYNLGINAGAGAGNLVWASNTLSVGTTYLVVISIQIVAGASNDIARIWIDPATGGSEPAANQTSTNTGSGDNANIQRVFFRQDAAGTTPGSLSIDELRVGTSWASVTPSGTPPSITSALTASGTVGVPFTYNITADNGPTRFYATGLPPGLSVDTLTGAITGTPTTVGSGTYNVTISASNGNGSGTPQTLVITINIGSQTITFNALTAKTFGDAPFNLTASASSGLTVSYVSSDTTVATISGNTVTIVGAGSTDITALQGGNADYNAATPVMQTLTVNKANQTITFGALSDKLDTDVPFVLTATSSSGLPVSYSSSNTSVISISNDTATVEGAGNSLITASQAGNANYNPAISVQQNQLVNSTSAQNQTITFDSLDTKIYGDAPFQLTATASSGLTVSYTSSDTLVATVAGDMVTITGPGTTIITASQGGNMSYNPAIDVTQSLVVDPKELTTTGDIAQDKQYDGNTGAVITGSTLVGVVGSDDVTVTGGGTFADANVNNNIAVTANLSLAGADAFKYTLVQPIGLAADITPANQTITFNPLPAKIFNDAPFALTATASSGLTVTYISSDTLVATVSGNTVTILSAGSTIITASQAGNSNYLAATDVAQTLTVNQASQTITFAALPNKTTADAPFNLTATASSGLTVSYTSSDTLVATVSGNTVTIVGRGVTTITASQAGNTNYAAAPDVLRTLTVTHPVIVAWQFGVPASTGSELTYNATTNDANLNTTVLSRGSGIAGTALGRAFSANGFSAIPNTKNNAFNTNQYFTFTINTKPGYMTSLTTLDARLRRTAAGPNAYVWTYSIDGGANFVDIGTDVSFTSTADGVDQSQISLEGISALQNVVSGTNIIIRIYAWGATATSGTFAIGRYGTAVTTNSLYITGNVVVAPSITTGTITGSPFCVTSTDNTPVSVPYTSTGAFGAGNVFTAQLSNASGSFASPVNIGTLAGTSNNGTVNAFLPAGTAAGTGYVIRVVSSNPAVTGTADTTQLTINTIGAVNASNSGPICAGQQLNLFASGGTSYAWSGPNSFASSDQNPVIVTTVAADSGIFSVIINNGVCQDTATTLAYVQDCGCVPPTLSVVVDSVVCNGENTGSINLSVTGATAPFTYSWSNGETTEDIDSVAAGNYSVIVTDSTGCSDTLFVTVYEPELLTLSITSVDPSCNGSLNGTINSTVMGGTLPYSFVWSSGSFTEDLSGLGAGTYDVTVTDGNGCSQSGSVTLTDPGVFSVSATSTSPICSGGTNGSIDLSASNDTIPNTTNPGLLISEFLANPSGTDSPFEWAELIATKSIDFSVTPYTVIFANNGVGTTKGWTIGGVIDSLHPSASYAFEISTGIVNAGDVVYVGGSSMTPTGTKLRVLNTLTTPGDGGIGGATSGGVLGNGGGNADAIGIFSLPAAMLDSNSVPADAILFGGAIGTALVNGGAAGYTLPVNDRYNGGYIQSNSFFGPDMGGTSNVVRATGSYNINTGAYTTPRTWALNAAHTNSASAVSIVYTNTYVWSNGATSQDITGLAAGNYSVIATSPSGCSDTLEVTLTDPPSMNLSFNVTDATCFGNADGSIDLTVSGGSGTLSYLWSNAETTEDLVNLTAGTYIVTVTDANGCAKTDSTVVEQPDELSLVTIPTDATCAGANNGSIDLTVTGGTAPYLYSYSTGDSTEDVSGLAPDLYFIEVTDANGCIASTIEFINEPAPLVISSFTPMSGVIGDTITISGSGFTPVTNVMINATAATFLVNSDNEIIAIVSPGTTSGTITITALPGCSVTSDSVFTINSATVQLDLKVFIEGYYVGGGFQNSPLQNSGFGGPTDADTIRVELRDMTDPTIVIASVQAVMQIDGTCPVIFPGSVAGSDYYIAIFHQNAVQTWSALPVTISAGLNDYDFTTDATQAFGDNMKFMETGVWALFTGDINQDEFIDVFDFPTYDSDNLNLVQGYVNTDLNGDGFVDVFDFPAYDYNNLNLVGSVHP